MPSVELQEYRENSEGQKENLVGHMTGIETSALVDSVQTWRYSVDSRQHGFFLAKKFPRDSLLGLGGSTDGDGKSHQRPTTPGTPGDRLGFTWIIGSLADYETGFFNGVASEDRFVCFTDPSTYPEYPGWMLRNLLVLVHRRWKLDKLQVLCYRDVQARRDEAKSIVLSVTLADMGSVTSSLHGLSASSDMPKVTGWERNHSGKVMSRIANLGEYMDPQRYKHNIA